MFMYYGRYTQNQSLVAWQVNYVCNYNELKFRNNLSQILLKPDDVHKHDIVKTKQCRNFEYWTIETVNFNRFSAKLIRPVTKTGSSTGLIALVATSAFPMDMARPALKWISEMNRTSVKLISSINSKAFAMSIQIVDKFINSQYNYFY